MPVVHLTELDDPLVDDYRDLTETRRSRRRDRFVVEGHWLVERLLGSRHPVHSILVESPRLEELLMRVPAEANVLVAPPGSMDQIVGFAFHRGVLACGGRLPTERLVEAAAFQSERWVVAVCVNVSDPVNLGGILRNCAAFGVAAVVLGPGCADHLSRRAVRVSMGGVFDLSIIDSDDLGRDLLTLRQRMGADITATVLDDRAERLAEYRRCPRTAVLFGSEGHGISDAWLARCNRKVKIPIRVGVDSLNVAVASGIVLHWLDSDPGE